MGSPMAFFRAIFNRYNASLIAALTVLAVISAVLKVTNLHNQAIHLASEEANSNWNKDQAFRTWASDHGGVYVKVDEHTQPNPYLEHIPDRDIETITGDKLTLMNPAYIMKQMTDEFEASYGIKGKLTGQILINPANKADPWELSVLKQFAVGVEEVLEQVDIDGLPFLRLMRPMVMKESCIRCHGHLGFNVGDIRGGLSLSVPLTPYFEFARNSQIPILMTHIIVWMVGFLTIAYISHRKYLQDMEREHARQVLENTVDQLLVAKTEAEEANEAKSEFLASMSHELRTPLNAVLGFAQMLEIDLDKPLEPAQKLHVARIKEGGNQLLGLVNDILDLARIESGHLTLTIESVSANNVVSDCLAMISHLAVENKITIIDEIRDEPAVMLRTDQLRLNQILINLLSNAVKFNNSGGTVTVKGSVIENGFYRISVTDTGIGISKADCTKIFNMFHRVGANSKIARDGTGIGLTVTKLLVERLSGSIDVESDVGQGSTFWFDLPLASNQNVSVATD